MSLFTLNLTNFIPHLSNVPDSIIYARFIITNFTSSLYYSLKCHLSSLCLGCNLLLPRKFTSNQWIIEKIIYSGTLILSSKCISVLLRWRGLPEISSFGVRLPNTIKDGSFTIMPMLLAIVPFSLHYSHSVIRHSNISANVWAFFAYYERGLHQFFYLILILPLMLLGELLTNRNISYIKAFGICPSPRATGGNRTHDPSVTRHDYYRCRYEMKTNTPLQRSMPWTFRFISIINEVYNPEKEHPWNRLCSIFYVVL
jgi:hypothetical protein